MVQPTVPGLPNVDAARRNRLLKDVLKGVSRSFYLTIRILPKDLREPVGLAYLLARAGDTIADRRLAGRRAGFPGQRLQRLITLRTQVAGPADLGVLQELTSQLTEGTLSPQELAMFGSLVDTFALLESLNAADQKQVRWVVTTLTQGMEMDLTSFPGEDSGELRALSSADELDRYVYLVAGCVGEFWTRVTTAHVPNLKGWDVEQMSETGVRFGKALQLTNVLRDMPRDLRRGRCYLPADELAAAGLVPEDLLDPENEGRARPVLATWIRTALGHFDAAEEYLLAVPRRSVRLRLACLWPLLLGLATLARLARSGKWLDPDSTVKVSRGWVYRMMAMSLPAVSSNSLLRFWIKSLRRQVEAAI
ncbi:MAG: squalene/phytoene synthase family protein [Chloroflexi bacterium]|nr:squalene/phytoene synthase family protein [Chloroflexota bacterium]